MSVFWHLRWFFREEWRRYGIAVLALIIVGLAVLVPPWITGRVVDAIADGSLTRSQLLMNVGIVLAVALVSYTLRVVWRVALFGASFALANRLRQDLYQHLTLQPPSFFAEHKTGDLMARATNDIQAVEMTAGEAVLALFDGALTGLLVLIVLTTQISWQLTLVALLPWPIVGYFMWRFGQEMQASFHIAQARFSDLNDRVQESLAGIRLIRAFGREHVEDAGFNAIAREANEANQAVARTDSKYDPAISLAIGSSFFLSVAGGAWLIAHDSMTLGELTSFTLYLGFMIWPMFAVGWMLNLVERGQAAYQRIQEIFDTEPAIKDSGTFDEQVAPALDIAIREFRHAPDLPPVLSNIKLTVEPGQLIGLVGATGSGKTSLIDLILRLSESPDAPLTLGGKPLAEFSLANLRRHLAVVPQSPFLFSASVAENIALAKPDATVDDIETAAKLAQVHDDIQRFADGYATRVGERGVTLSGGQKQRLALARALLLDAPVLVLDDALSAVDLGTEKHILAHLKQARAGRTTLIACHRLSAVEQADEILVLDQGRVLERGTHAQLLAENGWYKRTYDYQQLERTVEDGR
ncbi:multidrug ABC transporter permease/ATP-binding protein [Saccharospirillum sp. MSK14-1]|uniref:ABC transporter transmembrane domain-containing protein n=1 Tax=Saccharospirillum sp. MSK14-1 TaxID=1897632 RepID=UPI000D3A5011|nr:ABC transporter transmembrane domain-containing protein [Saccharospirillum sp. MSK14-1]PTY37878.1 multidrug ABC transporter permease/ATP-binding protein [Saccharospirillum sp. MSK14-1]